MRWPWQQKEPKPTEAKEHLQRIIEREPEVKRLADQLRDAQRRNHFSNMVIAAMGRGTNEGDSGEPGPVN
jgi:hypothetical protein